jgi:hypothetical protein
MRLVSSSAATTGAAEITDSTVATGVAATVLVVLGVTADVVVEGTVVDVVVEGTEVFLEVEAFFAVLELILYY